jgi:hypothetical protein
MFDLYFSCCLLAEFYSDEESELLANPQLPSADDLKHAAANVG